MGNSAKHNAKRTYLSGVEEIRRRLAERKPSATCIFTSETQKNRRTRSRRHTSLPATVMVPPTATAAPDAIASTAQVPNLPTAQPIKRSLQSNLGPLTTTFTPPADCNTLLVRTIITSGDQRYDQFYVGYGETCTVADDGNASTFIPESCYPGAFADWFNDPDRNIPDRIDPVAYSPGLVCPVGYEIACSLTRSGEAPTASASSDSDIHDLWDILNDGETAIGCCPS